MAAWYFHVWCWLFVIWVGLNKQVCYTYIYIYIIFTYFYVDILFRSISHVDDINERFNSNYAQLVVALHFETLSAPDPSMYLYAPFQTVLPSDHSSIDVMSWLAAHVQSGNAPNTMLRIHHKPAPVWAWFSRPSLDLPSLFCRCNGRGRGKEKRWLMLPPLPMSEFRTTLDTTCFAIFLQYFLALPQINI